VRRPPPHLNQHFTILSKSHTPATPASRLTAAKLCIAPPASLRVLSPNLGKGAGG